MGQQHQELAFPADYDYRGISPHIRHHRLNELLREHLLTALRDVRTRGLPVDLLEIGAGDGAFVEPALAYGARVTATEMSRPAIARLQASFGGNPAFDVHFDPHGTFDMLRTERFTALLYASVLHHIPDYIGALRITTGSHLQTGGCLVTLQDPLWYPTLPAGIRQLDDAAFLAWRVAQANLTRGLHTRVRRLRGVYDDDKPGDTVEYHVVRLGVDQMAIMDMLRPRFEQVSLFAYWSTATSLAQRLGESLGLHNTFAIVALGYDGGSFT